jgi:mono/diheme cytochrome c family protein
VIEQYVSASELRRLASALIVVIGFIAITAFFAFLVVPGQRYQAHTSNETTVVAVQGDSGWLDPTDYLPSRRIEIPPIDPATVMTANAELLERGKFLYGQTCLTCHGPSGQGDGAGGRGLNPPPRNFTSPSGWKNGTRLEEIFSTLERGVTGSAMVSYNYLSKKDRMALAHYVQSLGSFDHGQSDPKARALLENLFANQGEVIPNRIPVKDAISRIVSEYEAVSKNYTCGSIGDTPNPIADPARVAITQTSLTAGDPVEFARKVAVGVPMNGFAPQVGTYTSNQWNQLRLCLERQ